MRRRLTKSSALELLTEARTDKGELYKSASLISIKRGINIYLSNSKSGLDIVNGKNFKKSQTSFKAMVFELKKEGKEAIDHHLPIDRTYLLKLNNYFYESRESPAMLKSKVLVDISVY